MKTGPLNLITDIAGLTVGNAQDADLKSGVSALICDVENVTSVHVMGGAPGSRETDLLQPENTVQSVEALVLSGGSAFGLDAAAGVQSALRAQGKGFQVFDQVIPIVPAAILFDLINGGNKDWGLHSPYRDLGVEAAQNANRVFDLGSVGAGTGATTGGPVHHNSTYGLKGGLGSASTVMENGVTIGALVAVNALGSPTVGNSANFWASPFEIDDEFGALGACNETPLSSQDIRIKFRQSAQQNANTTIGIIATDAVLTKGQAKRFAMAAHDGFARAIWPAHTPLDGDLIFGLSTGGSEVTPNLEEQIDMSAIAASTMARAIARGVFNAKAQNNDIFPTWNDRFTAGDR